MYGILYDEGVIVEHSSHVHVSTAMIANHKNTSAVKWGHNNLQVYKNVILGESMCFGRYYMCRRPGQSVLVGKQYMYTWINWFTATFADWHIERWKVPFTMKQIHTFEDVGVTLHKAEARFSFTLTGARSNHTDLGARWDAVVYRAIRTWNGYLWIIMVTNIYLYRVACTVFIQLHFCWSGA